MLDNTFYQNVVKIDKVILGFDKETFLSIKDMLNYTLLLNYFYEEVSKRDDVYIYFNVLFKHGYFNPDYNPSPVESKTNKGFYNIPYWSTLKVLDKVIIQNEKKINIEVSKKLNLIVESLVNRERIDNYYTDVFILKVLATIPYKLVRDTEKYFEYFDKAINSNFGADYFGSEIGKTLIPRAVEEENEELLMHTMKLVFKYKKEGTDYIQYKAKINDYWLEDIITKYKSEIYKLLNNKIINYCIEMIKDIIKGNDSSYSFIEINYIERKSVFGSHGFKRILLDFVRDGLKEIATGIVREYTEKLWNEEHPIFKRLALFSINEHYNEFKDIFWNVLPTSLEETNIKHELFRLVEEKANEFTSIQKGKLIELIEAIKFPVKDGQELREKREAYRKKEWLSALIKTDDKKITALYNKYCKIISEDIPHPGEPIHTYTTYGYDRPEDIQKIENKDISKQIEYLNNVSESYTEGSRRYYKNLLIQDVSNLIDNLSHFKKATRPFQHSALWALSEVWRKGTDFEWENIFKFISYLFIEDANFWIEIYDDKENYRDWIISISLELISEGVTDDNHAFDIKYYDTVKKLLIELYKKMDSDTFDANRIADALFNDNQGKLYSAMISLMLSKARKERAEKGYRWDNHFKEIFEKEMERNSKSSSMFSGMLGRYLINFFWVDENWCKENFNRIFPENNVQELINTFSAYLFYNSRIYTNVYSLFLKHKIFKIALSNFKESDLKEKLVQFIIAGYIYELENKKAIDELLDELLTKADDEIVREIINYCARSSFSEDISQKIKTLWERIHSNALEGIYKYNESIISDLCKWIKFFPRIIDIGSILIDSVKYADWNYNIRYLMDAFDKQIANHPKEVGKLIIKMIDSEHNKFYYAKEDKFINLVKILYDKKETDIANYICNNLGEKGHYFLKAIWLENNS